MSSLLEEKILAIKIREKNEKKISKKSNEFDL